MMRKTDTKEFCQREIRQIRQLQLANYKALRINCFVAVFQIVHRQWMI